jgi:hypothetical protein
VIEAEALIHEVQYLIRIVQQVGSRFSQQNLPPQAIEKVHAQFFLQGLILGRDAGLSIVEPFRGLIEAQEAGHCLK